MSTNQNTFEVIPVQQPEIGPELQKWPENGASSPQRRENGQLLPGVVLNPGGRPKSKHITEAYKQIAEERGADELAKVVWTDALTAKKPSERLAAVQEITDRIEGKAVASMVIGHTFDPASLDRLSTMLDKLNAPGLPEDGDD